MSAHEPTVRYHVESGVAAVTLDRPQSRNALGPEEWAQLATHVGRAAADASVRVLRIAGAGGFFSSGGDLRTMPERLALEHPVRRAQLLEQSAVIRALHTLGKPVVATIAGGAVGAGLALALACDLRLAAADARFAAGFHRVGLTADFGLLWLLGRIVGPARAADLLYSAESIDAQRAESIGLVSRLCEPERLEEESRALCRRLADGPPIAMAKTKEGLALTCGLDEFLQWEADAQATCSRTNDAREGVAAFLENRAARFVGK